MNSVVLVIFMLVGATVSLDSRILYEDLPNSSLVIVKKRDSSKLELAIPQKSLWDSRYADYPYKESHDEKFMIACPAISQAEREFEDEWKGHNNVPKSSKLFILKDYTSDACPIADTPSIEKAQKKDSNDEIIYCGDYNAEIYNVGFPDFQFMPIYRICYSPTEGTRYTIHRIESPSLLLQDEMKYHKFSADDLFGCFLDTKCYSCGHSPYKNEYAYQFVGIDDMPTKVWGSTTRFSFNYIPLTKNRDLMEAMLLIDNFIRLYSKMTDEPLTLYSGIYRTTVNVEPLPCLPTVLCGNIKPTAVNLFWRIIMNDKRFAIVIVTQYTKMKCVDKRFLCKGDHRTMITEYKNGGCTYLCSVEDYVIRQLGLPQDGVMKQLELPSLSEAGFLKLEFPKKTQANSVSLEEGQSKSDGKSFEYVSIFDIFGEKGSKSALETTDPKLAASIRVSVPKIGRI